MHHEVAYHFLWIGGAILTAVVFGTIAKNKGQPRVLGGLLAGIFIGVAFTWTDTMHDLRSPHGIPLITGIAELAAMLLLFKAGLEGNLHSIIDDAKVGWRIAIIGVVLPLTGGFAYVFILMDVPWPVAFFQGGVFAATSVGITAAVLTELGLDLEAFANRVKSAAVIDDVLALIGLTIAIAVNTPNPDLATVVTEIGGAALFIVLVPLLGHRLAPAILRKLSSMDEKAREAIVLGFMVLYGAAAMFFGLAAIVGAYFAGVALEEIYFGKKHDKESEKPVEHFIDDLITALGPVFFVYAGCIIDPLVFLDPVVLAHGLAFTAIALAGKLACGLAVKEDRLLVGVSMTPRGEVGIIFAGIGLSSNVLTPELFGASMIMVLLTTVVTPPGLTWLKNRRQIRIKLQSAATLAPKAVPVRVDRTRPS